MGARKVVQRTTLEPEQAIRLAKAREARHRALLDLFPDLILVISRRGIVIDHHVTKHSRTLWAVLPQPFHDRRLADLFPGPCGQSLSVASKASLRTGQIQTVALSMSSRGHARRRIEARVVPGRGSAACILRDLG